MKKQNKGYYGFPSRDAYEAYYDDFANWAWEIPAMEAYTRETEAEQARIIELSDKQTDQ